MSYGRVKEAASLALAGLVAMLIVAQRTEAFAEGFGPFPVRNFQPIQLLFLGMQGDRATVINKRALDVRVEMASTSTVFREETGRVSTMMKFETLRSGLFFRYGLTERLEVGLEVPVLYRYRGFLEGAITATERATTGVAPARSALKGTGFAYNLSQNGRTLFSGGEGELGLGDMTLSGKYQFLFDQQALPAVALRMAVKVPSGDDRRFFGSGHADVGMGLAVEKAVAARWIVYGNLNGILPTGKVAGKMLRPTISAIAAVEYLWSPAVSLVAQFDYYSSPFKSVGTPVLDEGVTEVAAGFNYRLRNNLLWQVYGVENLDFIRGSAADFTLSTLVTYRFGT
ncbi:MAG: DUF3187 family protein [Nitrospirae bacterium]|nr:DUF3187 family protein [Nitrospirota bacterium]